MLLHSFISLGFIPHGYCYLWKPGLVSLHIASDALIAIAYYCISIAIIYFIQQRDLPFKSIFWLFSALLVACGTIHIMEVWTLWFPTYWVSSFLKAFTALIFIWTTFVVLSIIPKALALPTTAVKEANSITAEISDRSFAEAALQTSNLQVENILESISDGFSIINHQWQFTYINPQAEPLLNRKRSELLGKNIWEEFPEAVKSKFYCEYHKAVEQQVTVTFEEFYQPFNAWYEVRAYPSADGLATYFQDISDRKSAELALKQINETLEIAVSERTVELSNAIERLEREISSRIALEKELALRQARFDAFFTAAPVGLVIVDNDLRVVQMNEAMAEMSGPSVADHLGKTFREILPNMAPILESIYQGILTTGEPLLNTEVSGKTSTEPGLVRHWMCSYFPLIGLDGLPDAVGAVAIEISDRKRTEQALQESQRFNEKIALTNPNILYIYDLIENCTIYSNRQAAEVLGYTPGAIEEMGANVLPNLMHPDDFGLLIQHFNSIVTSTSNGIFEIEYRMKAVSGEWHWFRSRDTVFSYTEQGTPHQLLGTAEDITERKHAEEEQQKLIAIIESSSDFIGLATLEGQTLFINEAGQKLVGLSGIEQAQQIHISEYHLPEDLAEMREKIIPTVMEKGRWEGESRFRHWKTGEAIPAHFNVFIVKDRQTLKPIALAIVSRDISSRILTEQELRQSETRLREIANKEALLNRLNSQIRASLDINTILETAVTEVRNLLEIDRCMFIWYRHIEDAPYWEIVQEAKNPDLHSFIGFQVSTTELGQMSEKSLNKEIIRIDDVQGMLDELAQKLYLALGFTAALTLPIHTQSGEIGVFGCAYCNGFRPWRDREVELLSAVADQLAIAIDQAQLFKQSELAAKIATQQATKLELTLHELQQTQSQLIQTEKMSGLGQLVAGVAHEINNPINFIYGNINPANEYVSDLLHLVQLYQKYYPHPAPEIKDYVQAIDLDFIKEDLPKILASMKMGADRIRDLVLSLRNFSRLDEAEKKAVNIHDGLDSTLLILQNRLKAKPDHPAIEVIKQYGNLPDIQCYPGQLNQVFMNILSNAMDALDDYNKKRSPAEIKNNPSLIIIRTFVADDNSAIVQITDNGMGMPEEVRRRVFDPFFTTKPVGSGTGLGMSISYQIVVEKHGGQLKCISAPGQGAEFNIEIPIRQQKDKQQWS